MDTGTVITGIIIIAVCVVLFLMMNRGQKNRKSHMLDALSAFASQSDITIAQSDTWVNGAIGADAAGSKLCFLRKKDQETQLACADLKLFNKAFVNSVTRSVGEKGELRAIDRLELVLVARDKKQADAILEFYNVDCDSLRLMGEPELVEKWDILVNEMITSLQQKK